MSIQNPVNVSACTTLTNCCITTQGGETVTQFGTLNCSSSVTNTASTPPDFNNTYAVFPNSACALSTKEGQTKPTNTEDLPYTCFGFSIYSYGAGPSSTPNTWSITNPNNPSTSQPSNLAFWYLSSNSNNYGYVYPYTAGGSPSSGSYVGLDKGWLIDPGNSEGVYFIQKNSSSSSGIVTVTVRVVQSYNAPSALYLDKTLPDLVDQALTVTYYPPSTTNPNYTWTFSQNNYSTSTSTLEQTITNTGDSNFPFNITNSYSVAQPILAGGIITNYLVIQSLIGIVHACYKLSVFNSENYDNNGAVTSPSALVQNEATNIFLNAAALYNVAYQNKFSSPN